MAAHCSSHPGDLFFGYHPFLSAQSGLVVFALLAVQRVSQYNPHEAIMEPFYPLLWRAFLQLPGPWYYPLAIFLITTPLLHLVSLFTGIAILFKDARLWNDLKTILLLVCFATPFVLLILPMSPAHDGIRYLLPAIPFAACFMTTGLLCGWRFVTQTPMEVRKGLAARCAIAVIAVAFIGADLHSPARYPPFELSYYNQLVEGLSGAHRRGYETTYWWEILNHRALEKINGFCRGASVYFPIPPTDLFFKQMKAQGKIAFEPAQDRPDEAGYVLIMGRPFVRFWETRTWPLYRRAGKTPEPVWGITLDSVPLLKLYRIKKK